MNGIQLFADWLDSLSGPVFLGLVVALLAVYMGIGLVALRIFSVAEADRSEPRGGMESARRAAGDPTSRDQTGSDAEWDAGTFI